MNNLNTRPIVLLTDFGHTDTFAGVLKGVIAGISPATRVIDLSHGVQPQNILQAAFLLRTSYAYFPRKTIFCVIVDPGVGSTRKGICIETADYIFVGPDNGVLWPAAHAARIEKMVHLTRDDYFLNPVSHTFPGRDIFAPVAARISRGITDIGSLGPVLTRCETIEFPKPVQRGSVFELTVLHTDCFGNLTLNIEHDAFRQYVKNRPFSLMFGNARVTRVCDSYSQAPDGLLVLIFGSSGYMEVSKKNTSAASDTGLQVMNKGQLQINQDVA